MAVALVSEAAIVGSTVFVAGPNVFLAAVLRSDVIQYTVEARESEGGQALRESELLDAAAQAKADDMAAKGYFSHVGPDGQAPWTWVSKAGYDYVYAGENLAVRFNDSKDVVDAWMASPTHRANIVKPQYQEIGVGLAEGMYKGSQATFVVQFFASPNIAHAASAPSVSTAPPAQESVRQSVAGAEVAPEQAPADVPTQADAQAPMQEDTSASPAQVSAPAPAPSTNSVQSVLRGISKSFDARTGASWVLGGIAALLITVLALTFVIRIQVQPTDLLLPGLAVALVAVALMGANAKFLPSSQSASVGAALGQGEVGEAAAVQRVNVVSP